MGPSDYLGGIWEINFFMPHRDGPGCQVPDGAVDGAGVRPLAAAGCQQLDALMQRVVALASYQSPPTFPVPGT
jgi:hypothetical protein